MSRRASLPLRKVLPVSALLPAAVALFAFALPAHAGLGDMMKKAKDKALQTAGKKVDAESRAAADKCKVEFDPVTLELTDARIQSVLATFKAAGEAGAGRPAMVDTLNKLNAERSALGEKNGEAIRKAHDQRDEVNSCYQQGYHDVQQKKMEEYKNRAMSDPKLYEKFTKIAAENNAAAAKGDTAAINRANQAILEEMMPSKEDSAQVRKQCGPLPPKSAAEARLGELDVLTRQLEDRIAKLDERVAKAQAKQGGMDSQQWAMALERIQMYLTWREAHPKDKGAACGLTATETQLLDQYRGQLKALLG